KPRPSAAIPFGDVVDPRIAVRARDITADVSEAAARIDSSAADGQRIHGDECRVLAHTIAEGRPTAAVPFGDVIRRCVPRAACTIATDLCKVAARIEIGAADRERIHVIVQPVAEPRPTAGGPPGDMVSGRVAAVARLVSANLCKGAGRIQIIAADRERIHVTVQSIADGGPATAIPLGDVVHFGAPGSAYDVAADAVEVAANIEISAAGGERKHRAI